MPDSYLRDGEDMREAVCAVLWYCGIAMSVLAAYAIGFSVGEGASPAGYWLVLMGLGVVLIAISLICKVLTRR